MPHTSYIKILDGEYNNTDELFNEHRLDYDKIHSLKTVAKWNDAYHPYIAEYFRQILVMRSFDKPKTGEEFALRIRSRELNEFTLYIMSQWQKIFAKNKYSADVFSGIMKDDTENSQNFLRTVEDNEKERLIFVYQLDVPKPKAFWDSMMAKTKLFNWKL